MTSAKQPKANGAKRSAKALRAIQARRAAEVDKKLAAWLKRMGIAVSKVREYIRRASYYRKVLSAPPKKIPTNPLRQFDWEIEP